MDISLEHTKIMRPAKNGATCHYVRNMVMIRGRGICVCYGSVWVRRGKDGFLVKYFGAFLRILQTGHGLNIESFSVRWRELRVKKCNAWIPELYCL